MDPFRTTQNSNIFKKRKGTIDGRNQEMDRVLERRKSR